MLQNFSEPILLLLDKWSAFVFCNTQPPDIMAGKFTADHICILIEKIPVIYVQLGTAK